MINFNNSTQSSILPDGSERSSRLQFFQSMIGRDFADSPSPFGRWLNGSLIEAEAGSFRARFTVRPDMINPYGSLHGGVISGMMDDLIGATIHALELGANYSNLNFNVDFLSPAWVNEVVELETRIVRAGKQIINAEAMLYSYKGILLARGSTNITRISAPLRQS